MWSGTPGQAKTVRVVGDHEVTVAGAVDVELERGGAVGKGLLESFEGVLGQQGRGPAVGEKTEVVATGRHTGSW